MTRRFAPRADLGAVGNGHEPRQPERTHDLELVRDGDAAAPAGGRRAGTTSEPFRRYHDISVGLATSDAICVMIALIVSYSLRFGGQPLPMRETLVIALAPLLWVPVFHSFDLYAPQHLSAPEELRRVIGASGVGMILLVMASFWSKASFSRLWVGGTWALVLALELLPRRLWRAQQWRLRLDGRLALRTLIVGTSAEARRLVSILRAPASGFLPLGHVRVSDAATAATELPVLGGIGDLEHLVDEHAADCLFVASNDISVDDMARVARHAQPKRVEVRVLANLPQLLTSRLALLKVGPAVVLALRPVRLSGRQAVVKRTVDLVAASVALILSLPLCAVIAIAIRLDSGGPVLFHQERVTKGGRVFRMHKFRTMRTEPVAVDTSRPFFKLQADPRLTRVGAFLRRYSLDELPQLWNIITGEMSLVGPRPLPVDQVAANRELLSPREAVPAGLTGWWQINGRSLVTPEESLGLDLFYIENWSPSLDLYVLLKTLGVVVGRQGAY